jgi:hypothetical protein
LEDRLWERPKPIIRQEDLVVQDLNNEVLIYDLKRDKAFCLNETAAIVWRACDGSNTVGAIGRQLGSEDAAWLALNDLRNLKLIEHTITTPSKFKGMSRREVLTKISIGSILALPMIAALYAPAAAQAGSDLASATCGLICAMNSQCELLKGMGMTSDCPFCTGPMGGVQRCAEMLFAG